MKKIDKNTIKIETDLADVVDRYCKYELIKTGAVCVSTCVVAILVIILLLAIALL